MVDIQSKEVIDKISDELKVQPAVSIPRGLMEKIQLSYSVNPKRIVNVVRNTQRNTTGSATVFATSPDRDFFLTSAFISAVHDATSDGTEMSLNAFVGGVERRILQFTKLTTTIFNGILSQTYTPPIKIDRNTNITINNSFTAGASTISTVITGFETDPQ